MVGQQNQNIRVYVRSRPLNSNEKSQGSTSVLNTSDHTVTVKERPQDKFTKTFTFDRVFGEKSRQVDVYRTVVMPLLEEVLLGYNCTVFAYGQTGTGKTFTMEGESSGDNTHWDQDPGMGIIPRTLSQLFDELRMQGCEFTVRVSFLELYNEELFDLLSPASDTSKLRLYEDSARKGSCIIQGLEEAIVHNKNEVYKILQQGSAKRQTAATLMNAHSSRSHTVFSVTVHIKENNVEGEELLKIGKLNLVDLAGSENIGRSGAIDRRAREAGNINMSLLTLGRVITSLVECAPHVPYRESKLTRLLQDSLGGRTKTSIIATVSPATCNLEETLSTLDYAHRAKKITNRPEVNQKLTKKTLLKEYTGEIERLRRDLTATREQNGVFLAAENYQQMLGQIEEQTKEIVDKVGHIRALQEQLEGVQGMFSDLKEEADGHKAALQQTREVLTGVKLCLERTETECEEQQQLVSRHVDTEQKLSAQAGQLLNTVTRAAGDLQAVHGALERKRQVETENQSALEAFRSEYQAAAAGVLEQLERTGAEQLQFCRTEEQQLVQLADRRRDEVAAVSRRLAQLLGASTDQQRDLEAQLTAEAGAAHAWIAALLEQLGGWRDQQASSQQLLRQQIEEAFRVQRDGVEQLLSGERQQDAVVGKLVADNARDMRALVENMRQHAEQLQLQELQHSERQLAMLEESQRAQLPNQKNLTALTTGIGEDVSALNRQLAALTERVSQLSAAHTSIIDGHQLQLSGQQQLVEEQQRTVAEPLRQLVSCAGQGATFLDQHHSMLDATVQRRADTRDQQSSDSGDRLCAVQSAVSAAVAETQAVWDEAAGGCEQALRRHSEHQTAALQQSQRRVQTAAAGLQQAVADTDATHTQLGQQLCKDLEQQRAAVADRCQESQRAGDQLLATARHSQQLVHRLVDSELQEDRPSGDTPARRQFSYPRYLAATSPHQRILDRHRAARRTAADLAAAVPSPLADLEEAAGEAATPLSHSNSAPDLSADALTNGGAGSATSSRANSFVSDASDVSSAATAATDVENQAPEERKQKGGFRVPVSKLRSKRTIRGDKLTSTASAAAPPRRTALQQQNTK